MRRSVAWENGRLSSCAFIAWYIDIHAVTSMSIAGFLPVGVGT